MKKHLLFILNTVAPWGTRRRGYLELSLAGCKVFVNEGPRSLWRNYKRYRNRNKIIPTKVDRSSLSILTTKVEEAISVIDKQVTVVIPTKNAGSDFEFTLERIKYTKGITDIDIVVVDSGSTDGTLALAQKYGARVFSINPNEFNHGLTRNFGAAQGKGDYVLFMVQDAIPIGDQWLHDMVMVLESDPLIAAASCRQVPRSDADLFACSSLWNHYRYLWQSYDTITLPNSKFSKLQPREKRMQAGLEDVCCLIKRNIFDELKFRDVPYAEDLDLGLRLAEYGNKMAYLYSTAVIHSHNRLSSYLIRRSYVESKILPKILSYEPLNYYSNNQGINQVISNLTALYAAINTSTILMKSFKGSSVTFFDEFKLLVSKHIGYSTKSLSNFERIGNELDEVIDTIRRQVSETNLIPNQSVVSQYFASLDDVSLYLKECSLVNENANNMLASTQKVFAIVAGSILGSYYFTSINSEESTKQLQAIDAALSKGI
jgi:GT2 family glycosyltransferase